MCIPHNSRVVSNEIYWCVVLKMFYSTIGHYVLNNVECHCQSHHQKQTSVILYQSLVRDIEVPSRVGEKRWYLARGSEFASSVEACVRARLFSLETGATSLACRLFKCTRATIGSYCWSSRKFSVFDSSEFSAFKSTF